MPSDPSDPRPADASRRVLDSMWHDPGVRIPRRGAWREIDDQLLEIPTGARVPDAEPPQIPAWVTGAYPNWNDPPVRGEAFEMVFDACIPTYEQWYLVGRTTVPDMHMAVIEQLSYDVTAGLAQYELFEFAIRGSGTEVARIEDMIIDPMTGDPSHKFVFSGDTRPLPFRQAFDRSRVISIHARVRGIVDLAGVSIHMPGDILFPSAHLRILAGGFFAPFRRNLDGAPRQQDLGNMGFYDLDPLTEAVPMPE